ncbi:MAG: hypothetical protein ACI9WU_003956 [Myxococcota bacterium]|jgi:hypothetical protein
MRTMRKATVVTLTLTLTLTGLLVAGCGDDDPTAPALATQLCTAGESRCIGNASALCGETGLSWVVNQCGATSYCDAGDCKERVCPFPGQNKCKDHNTVSKCNALGTALSEEECVPGTLCVSGACLAAVCTEGATSCGWRSAANCVAGTWEETECTAGQVCADGACVAQTCAPESVGCLNDTVAQACNVEGSAWADTTCAANEQCYDFYGVCLPKLATEPPEPGTDVVEADADEGDVSEDIPAPPEDTGPVAELEPLDKAEVVINGDKVVFSSHKSGSYVETDSDLRITMDKGQQKIEISISPIEEFDVGQFSSQNASDINIQIWYHDGSPLVGQAQFRYVSVDYEVELLKFQSPEGRVKGTFSGTFTDDGGATTIPFTTGEFDVKRHD